MIENMNSSKRGSNSLLGTLVEKRPTKKRANALLGSDIEKKVLIRLNTLSIIACKQGKRQDETLLMYI